MKNIEKIESSRGNREIRSNFQNSIKIPAILIIFLISVVSCDWLDVMPDNIATIDAAFANRATAQKSLFSCYRYLPNPTDCNRSPNYFTSRDEYEFGKRFSIITQYPYSTSIAQGLQNANDPIIDYWSGKNNGRPMFEAIRTCNVFLEEIHRPRDMSEDERARWTAEVKFLKAYYHYILLQLYGPIPIVRENIPISAEPDEVKIFREPVDECIDYIAELIDEAAPDLPLVIDAPLREDGRITRPIALSVKAKVLVLGASPLFNGNEDYRDWRDSRGKQMISDYNREKWEKAAEAIKTAIDVCHAAGHQLYRYDKATNPQTIAMSDSLVQTMNVRKAITERWNVGVIWSSTDATGTLQSVSFPPLFTYDWQSAGGLSASFEMAELFYTNNGIPIDEDIHWDYAGRYQPRLSTVEAENGLYIAIGEQTAALHFDREPRFYANLAFDRGFVELSSTTADAGASFSPYARYRAGEAGDWVPHTGYLIKKLTAFETSCSQGTTVYRYTPYDYRFPLFRLADLYLLYSEALNEVKDVPDDEVYRWIDEVRAITGLKGVVASWQNSKSPNRPRVKDEMRKIIRQERMIELAFEGHRFLDIRRWKLAESLWTKPLRAWNFQGSTVEEFYTLINWDEARTFTFKDYLWPISDYDLRINRNLVQSYGW